LIFRGGTITKYHSLRTQRIALKQCVIPTYIHGDHLGSTSTTTNASGQCTSAQWYYAYGNIRTPAPTTPCSGTLPTDFTFTGQRRDASANLMYYGARYYDSALGRFVSADTVVPKPGNPQTLNRFAYAYNNPLRYIDPTGHDAPDIINFLGEFSTGAAFEAWTNIAWFIPGHENLQVQAGESEAMTAGRVFGDVLAIGIGASEMAGGIGLSGGGAAACGTAVLCVAGAPAMAVGVTVAGAGAVTSGTAIANGAQNLNNLISMAKGSNWKVGDPINMPDANGNYPDWATVRERYWKNRAQIASRGEFAPQNLGRMKQGLAPIARIIARIRATGQEVEMTVSMELHHIEGRGGLDPHNTDNLVEVWPWEHSGLDPNRYLDWDFVRFK
jgi:RHS repeat-associated protein